MRYIIKPERSLLVLYSRVCYRKCCLARRGEGPPGAPEPPYPQGVAAGARPGGPSPGFRACRGAGGASAVRSWSARGALRRVLSAGQFKGGMSDKVTYNTYTAPGAGVGPRVPWPPVLAVLEGGVAVGHGRPLSAGRGERGGAPAEKGGSTVHRHCVRCWPLPASPGLGRGCSPGRPGVVGRPRCLPAQGSVPSGRRGAVEEHLPPPGGARAAGPRGVFLWLLGLTVRGAAGRRGRRAGDSGPSPAHASICRRGRDLRGCRGGARRGTGDAGTRWRGASVLLEGGVRSASAGREHQRAPQGPAWREGVCFPVGEDGVRQTARGSSATMEFRDPPLRPGSPRTAARGCSVEREQGS